MDQLIVGERSQGKTTALIKMSAEGKGVIIEPTERGVKYVQDLAKFMGLDIPEPISWHNLITKNRGRRRGTYLLDELSSILGRLDVLSECKIENNMDFVAATLTENSVIFLYSQ